jgi:phosphoglycolate phosphatase-like HAD superfamily hydrolase
VRDIEGAHAAGIRAVAVTMGEYGPAELAAAAELVLDTLAELPDALSR